MIALLCEYLVHLAVEVDEVVHLAVVVDEVEWVENEWYLERCMMTSRPEQVSEEEAPPHLDL